MEMDSGRKQNGAVPQGRKTGKAMPRSVFVSIAGLAVMLALDVVLVIAIAIQGGVPIAQAASLAVGGLILWGLIVRHRLAWQLGRPLGFLMAVLFVVHLVVAATQVDGSYEGVVQALIAAVNGIIAVSLLAIFFALGTASAKRHFGLICPKCGKATSTGADFLFTKAKCSGCGAVW